MKYVLDANALIAFLNKETGASTVAELIVNKDHDLYVHGLNLCEVYYDYYRRNGESEAQEVIKGLLSLGIVLREDMDLQFWQQAGIYKANLRRVSLADCFCMSLTNRLNAQLVTADHLEFDIVAEQDVCRILFIR